MCTETYDPMTEEETVDPTGGEETAAETVDAEEAKTALAALKPTLMAIPASEVRLLRVGTTTAVGIGLAYARAFTQDRETFAELFTKAAFDVDAHDDLAERAKAFWRADIQMRQELGAEGSIRALVEEAKPLRAKLMKAATYLWGDDPDLSVVLTDIRKGQKHVDHADDLGALAELFTEYWNQAEGNCGVSPEDISRAEVLGAGILEALSPSNAKEIDEARDLRLRALRLRAAEHLRRGIDNIRDAACYAFRGSPRQLERYPSLFVNRGKKKSNGRNGTALSSEPEAEAPSTGPELSEPSAPSLAGPDEVTQPHIPAL